MRPRSSTARPRSAFENHYHLFKVTHQIRGDAVVGSPFDAARSGVTYLGDGNWGLVDNWANAKADAWYIKRATGDQVRLQFSFLALNFPAVV